MGNQISLRGFVSSEIECNTLDSGLVVGRFRMGSNARRLDPVTNQWVDGKTNWFRVNTFRALANNTKSSIHKGDRILVVGKLRVTSYLRKDGTPGTGVEIDADSIGPDLQFGIASYHRMTSARPAGQGNSSYDADSSYTSVPPLSEYPSDDVHGHEDAGLDDDQPDTEDGDLEEQAAASEQGPSTEDEDGDDDMDGERIDFATGEIKEEKVPF